MVACAARCARRSSTRSRRWLEELVPDADEDRRDADDRATLRLLFADTVRALRGDEMEFELLLPDDDAALDGARPGAVAVVPGVPVRLRHRRRRRRASSCSGEVEEVLRDLTHISQASVETGAESEGRGAGLRGDRRVRARRRAADPRRADRAARVAGRRAAASRSFPPELNRKRTGHAQRRVRAAAAGS